MLRATKTITSVVAAAGIMLSTIAPAAFAEVQIAGNGAFSSNAVSTSTNNSQRINQNNSANFNNNVWTNNNTGGNSSSFNTGGSSFINTGSANSSVDIVNRANSNVANVGNFWNTVPFNQNVGIFGNGFGSRNFVNSRFSNNSSIFQNNNSRISNIVNSRNNTGNNSAFGNTGGWWWGGNNGFSQINTGDANSGVSIDNGANSNLIQ